MIEKLSASQSNEVYLPPLALERLSSFGAASDKRFSLGNMNTTPPFTQLSLAAIPEGELVRSLLAAPHWREWLLGLHGIPGAIRPYPEVQLASLGKQGDIDILLVEPGRPASAIAIQVKRAKVTESTFANGKPNKLDAIDELKKQTNLLVELGFSQVLAYVIVVVDSRTRNIDDFRFDGLTPELHKTIESALSTEGLAEQAGLVRFEIVQPMDFAPLTTGSNFIRSIRMPKAQVQPQSLTEWITKLVRERDA